MSTTIIGVNGGDYFKVIKFGTCDANANVGLLDEFVCVNRWHI
jgi:hypothetical protein